MTVADLQARLYAALRHEKSCVCGECAGGLNAVDELVALANQAEEGLVWVREKFENDEDDTGDETLAELMQRLFDWSDEAWGHAGRELERYQLEHRVARQLASNLATVTFRGKDISLGEQMVYEYDTAVSLVHATEEQG